MKGYIYGLKIEHYIIMPFVIIPDDERKEVNIKHNISNRTFDSPG